jgi:hypothetical protein
VAIVLIGWSSLGDSAALGGITGLYPGYIPPGQILRLDAAI